MLDTDDLDCEGTAEEKEDAIVADAEPQFVPWWTKGSLANNISI